MTRAGSRRGAQAALVVVCSLTSLRAAADDHARRTVRGVPVISEADKATALAETREGNRLLDAGRPEEALARFQRAHDLVGGDKLHYNMGQALRAIRGREVDAFNEFDTFLQRVPTASSDLVEAAAGERASLAALLGFVSIDSAPPEAEVSVDGRSVGRTPLPRAIALQPGRHALHVEKVGFRAADGTVTVAAGERQPRSFVLLRLDPELAPPPPPPDLVDAPIAAAPDAAVRKHDDAPAPERRRSLTRRWWFWAGLAAVAAAGVAAAVVVSGGGGDVRFACPSGAEKCASLP
jgi:hypothetical protein